PPQDGERTVILRRVGKVAAAGALFHIPAGAHEDFAPLEVLASMLTAEPNGRLYKELVTAKKATSVSAVAFGWHDPGVLEVLASVDKGSTAEAVRDTMLDVLEKLGTQTIEDAEVGRARLKLARIRELQMADSNRIGVVLSDWAAK